MAQISVPAIMGEGLGYSNTGVWLGQRSGVAVRSSRALP